MNIRKFENESIDDYRKRLKKLYLLNILKTAGISAGSLILGAKARSMNDDFLKLGNNKFSTYKLLATGSGILGLGSLNLIHKNKDIKNKLKLLKNISEMNLIPENNINIPNPDKNENFSFKNKIKSLGKKIKNKWNDANKKADLMHQKRMQYYDIEHRHKNESLADYKRRLKKNLLEDRAISLANGLVTLVAATRSGKSNPYNGLYKLTTGIGAVNHILYRKRMNEIKDRLKYLKKLEYKKQMRV